MALYTEQQRKAVIRRAIEAGSARGAHGMKLFVAGVGKAKQTFVLTERGFCNRFVRQVFETALGLSPFAWYFGAAKACQTLDKLEPYRIALKDRRAGDILGFAGDPGHIAIYLGRDADPAKELVAENTSSGKRGWPSAPGTKLTSYETLRKRVTGCYRLFA